MQTKLTRQTPAVLHGRISAILLTGILATWLCPAGEFTYLETFDTRIVSDQLSTAVSNGVLRAWGGFVRHNPSNALPSLRSLGLPQNRPIKAGRDMELRADILRVTGEGGYAALGWSEEGIPAIGYHVLLNAQQVALVKHRFDQRVLSPIFWEPLPVTNRPMTVFLRFSMTESNLVIQTQVLDQEQPSQEIFERTVQDSPDREPVVAAPPPLQTATPDPGPAWRGAGFLQLSLFGANTNSARLEMEVDNFGVRQTQEVVAEDCLALIYTNAPHQTLPYRLFVPTNQQPGTLYPLVLHLHGANAVGDDTVSQFHPECVVFVSAESQARHPCFLVAPQMPAAVYQADEILGWWDIRDRVVGLVNLLQTQYPIDRDRIYLVGASLGGTGAWCLTCEYPDLFAAAVPLAGLGVSNWLKAMASVPIWAFHGANDSINPADFVGTDPRWPGLTGKGSRMLVADLRRLGACPIYTEYASPGHGIFGVAYDTPGLLDWLMAQRRGMPVQHSPWIAVTAPASNGVWTTSYTTLDLSGAACTDAGITNVLWRNETLNRSGPATGATNWIAAGIPLCPGRISGTAVIAATNVITVTATGTSWSELYGGTTTFNTTLRVVQIPIRLQARMEGGLTRLDWTGVAPAFVVQRCTDLNSMDWTDMLSTGETNTVAPDALEPAFYRIRLP